MNRNIRAVRERSGHESARVIGRSGARGPLYRVARFAVHSVLGVAAYAVAHLLALEPGSNTTPQRERVRPGRRI